MDRPAFEHLVADALASIPRSFRDAMRNLAIVVEDEPPPDLLAELDIEPPDTLPDATDPTTECAACGSTAVYLTEDGAAVCGKCGAALELEITEVNPA